MAETIQNTVDRLTAFISQNYTDIETAPGSVISELLIKLAAVLQNEQYTTVASLQQGSSIAAALASDTDTYSSLIDQIASNYNVARSSGTKVKGKIKVTVGSDNTYNLDNGYSFLLDSLNLTFVLSTNTRVSSTPNSILNEIQLYSDQGFYYFILAVEAENVGTEYQIPSGTVLSLPDTSYLADFVKAEAYGNFSSGKAIETDKELIGKIKYSLGNTRFESSSGIANNFSRTFAGFQSLSVCGANDPEMQRSKQNALGIATFGKADVYVRSSLGPETLSVIKTAKKVTENTWAMHLSNTDASGFYNIKSITPVTPNVNLGGTLIASTITYVVEPYPGERTNEIPSIREARFTKYQAADVTFTYADSPSSPIGTYADFDVHVTYQPNIYEMQNLLLADDQRLACADYLVKAVVPCMVSLNIKLLKKRSTDTFVSLNLQQLKKDLFLYVNTIPFGGELHASKIVDICHNYDIKRVDLPIAMTGLIICPDGSSIELVNDDYLTIPTDLAKGVSPKTTQYFIDYYRIDNGVVQPIDNIGLNIS